MKTKQGVSKEDNSFFMDGARSYVDVLIAIREYRKLVMEVSESALKSRIQSLGEAIGRKLLSKDIQPYANPGDIDNYNGWGAWIAARIKSSVDIYAGLLIGKEEDQQVLKVAVDMIPPTKDEKYRELCRACDGIHGRMPSIDSDHEYQKEIVLSMKFENIEEFEANLCVLLDQWVEVWKKAGAMNQSA